MIDFIIYEKDYELNNFYKTIIYNFLGCHEEDFKIFNYEDLKKSTSHNKIYILSSRNIKCLKIAKEIRTKGDWYSQIIIINENILAFKNNHLLILDYLSPENKNLKDLLYLAIQDAYKILTNYKTFKFTLNGVIYIIPYRDILYIEKGNNQNYSTIYTKNKNYIVKDTINSLEKQLDKSCFIKTHRSCIVNLNNITSYDCSNNIIYFNKQKIYLIARDKRKYLKEKLNNYQINY